MPQIKLPIVGGSYTDDKTVIDIQTCINLYAEGAQGSQKSPSALLSTPSITTLYDAQDNSPCRGMAALSNGMVYAVFGNDLYRLNEVFEKIPDIYVEGTKPIIIAENSRYACFVSDNVVYTLDMQTEQWQPYGESLLYPADDVTTLAQRFIFNRRDSGQIFWSDVLSTDIDALSYATAEASPDNVTAIKAHQKQLWVFGETTTEIWYATGDKDLPFAPVQGVVIGAGCLQPQTIAQLGESLIWLVNTDSGDSQIVMSQGYQLQRITNHALEKELRRYNKVDASAYIYQEAGHSFYVLTFPKANKTWVFDTSTSLWHERAIFKGGKFLAHPAKHHVMHRGKHIFSHSDKALLMGLGEGGVDRIGDEVLPQVRERTVHATNRTLGVVRHHRLTLLAQQGTSSSSLLNPQVMLSWSDNDGVTWSDTRWRGLGKQGQYQYRTFWTRLGASRNRAYRFRLTDAADLTIIGAELEVS